MQHYGERWCPAALRRTTRIHQFTSSAVVLRPDTCDLPCRALNPTNHAIRLLRLDYDRCNHVYWPCGLQMLVARFRAALVIFFQWEAWRRMRILQYAAALYESYMCWIPNGHRSPPTLEL